MHCGNSFLTNCLHQFFLCFRKGFLDLDAVMQKEAILQKEASGSTAVTILIKDDVLYCANAGDSRAVASINGKVITWLLF